jgi:hypothetical protein
MTDFLHVFLPVRLVLVSRFKSRLSSCCAWIVHLSRYSVIFYVICGPALGRPWKTFFLKTSPQKGVPPSGCVAPVVAMATISKDLAEQIFHMRALSMDEALAIIQNTFRQAAHGTARLA